MHTMDVYHCRNNVSSHVVACSTSSKVWWHIELSPAALVILRLLDGGIEPTSVTVCKSAALGGSTLAYSSLVGTKQIRQR